MLPSSHGARGGGLGLGCLLFGLALTVASLFSLAAASEADHKVRARPSSLPPRRPWIQVLRSRARGLVDLPPDLGRLSGRDPRAACAGLVASAVLARGVVLAASSQNTLSNEPMPEGRDYLSLGRRRLPPVFPTCFAGRCRRRDRSSVPRHPIQCWPAWPWAL
jgi:hypothetical protein